MAVALVQAVVLVEAAVMDGVSAPEWVGAEGVHDKFMGIRLGRSPILPEIFPTVTQEATA